MDFANGTVNNKSYTPKGAATAHEFVHICFGFSYVAGLCITSNY
jgi:hypothetical protein